VIAFIFYQFNSQILTFKTNANVKETRKNVTTKELQQRFTATKMADQTIQYNILARKHACAYYDINAAETACWRKLQPNEINLSISSQARIANLFIKRRRASEKRVES